MRGPYIFKGSALDRIIEHHGLDYSEAQFIMDLMEEGGFDFEAEDYNEKAMLHEAGLLINWTNKNGDWP